MSDRKQPFKEEPARRPTPKHHRVTLKGGTERLFTGKYYAHKGSSQ